MGAAILLAAALATGGPAAGCALSDADRAANATLGFEDFDQRGTLPSTARALSERGCWREAVRAAEDYLLNGPARSDHEQRVIVWHMAQGLALAGQEAEAARLTAATRVPAGNRETLDWNSYVRATWAFLVKDRPAFDAAAAVLARSTREPDRVNGAIVAAMGRCWDRPYRDAYNRRCGR